MKSSKNVFLRLSTVLLLSLGMNVFCVPPKDLLKKATVKDVTKDKIKNSCAFYYLFNKHNYVSNLVATPYGMEFFIVFKEIGKKKIALDEGCPEEIIIKNLLIKCWKNDSKILFKEKKNVYCDVLIKTFREKNS